MARNRSLKLWQQVYQFLLSNNGTFSYEQVGAHFNRPGRAIGPCMKRIGEFDPSITRRVVFKKDL